MATSRLKEESPMTTQTKAGAHALARRVAAVVLAALLHGPRPALAQETVVHYHTDAVGSVRMVTDEDQVPSRSQRPRLEGFLALAKDLKSRAAAASSR
jgi:hypothetical protein